MKHDRGSRITMNNDVPVVLIVDDDATFVVLLRHALSAKGYACFEASSAEKAQVMLTTEKVDVVLCDVSLPGIDGFEFCRMQRASPLYAAMPIVLLSGREDTNFFRLAREAGATDTLAKPGTFDQLRTLVGSVIEQALASRNTPGTSLPPQRSG